jgi:carbon monoxide dehydrogenase subunit G
MTSVERTFTVSPAPQTVLTYLKDFANAEEWDPGTQQCTRTDSGPLAVGAKWRNTSKFAGMTTELEYTLEKATGDQLVFVGKNDKATSTDTITVTPAGGGSQVRYHADLDMHGFAKLATPAIKLVFEKVASETEDQMVTVLNQLQP